MKESEKERKLLEGSMGRITSSRPGGPCEPLLLFHGGHVSLYLDEKPKEKCSNFLLISK